VTSRKGSIQTPEERFWAKVDRDGPTVRVDLGPCWMWTTTLNTSGYGQFFLNGRTRAAHRVAYEWTGKAIPDGYDLDHLCRVRRCVNPAHLEPITEAENARRANAVAGRIYRNGNTGKTHCKRGHAFDETNTYRMRDGGRRCRACTLDARRARTARRVKVGLARGERNSSAKLTDAKVREIRHRHAEGESTSSLMDSFGVHRSRIWSGCVRFQNQRLSVDSRSGILLLL